MKYIVKSALLLSIIIDFLYQPQMRALELILVFCLVSATLFVGTKKKFIDIIAVLLECIIILFIGIYTDYVFLALLILLFDCIYTKYYYTIVVFLGYTIYFNIYDKAIEYYLIAVLVGIIAYSLRRDEDNKSAYHNILDNERRTKYELELAKANLIKSNKEVEKLAEAKERNRIARDVHDNIGHSIAGILIKLQATKKVLQKDMKSGNKMLDECIVHLQNSLQLLRDTVHNMYSYENRGTDYIKNIIDEYKYCDASIDIQGDFSSCSSRTFQALSYVLKEALTNTSKHSQATLVTVELKSDGNIVAMSFKDNGIGCTEIKESLGIRSIRDRIKVLNGTFQIDGHNGMHMFCEIPLTGENK